MASIHISDIEAAINFWRERSIPVADFSLAPPTRALAEVYALLAYHGQTEIDERQMPTAAQAAWLAWFDSTPDTPCIAICTTSQGDAVCQGCGRTFEEVQRWTALSAAEKRACWRRISLQGSAWRFNRYAERAARGGGPDG
ncbi:DUF3717 domain-containing protein [Hydrogenophaga sp.]|uniref:DUF3717 domain-containing protein n=1 Tax=Hydrogenophaga sp. TaxID=1904254 RepID=UPI001988BC7F|nr:DUF3717 domain-containing protein [Hydrogenophaga sp.]MBD3893847.1 DUF3717 domain-containing protein [Hydrogenophaga sp.]